MEEREFPLVDERVIPMVDKRRKLIKNQIIKAERYGENIADKELQEALTILNYYEDYFYYERKIGEEGGTNKIKITSSVTKHYSGVDPNWKDPYTQVMISREDIKGEPNTNFQINRIVDLIQGRNTYAEYVFGPDGETVRQTLFVVKGEQVLFPEFEKALHELAKEKKVPIPPLMQMAMKMLNHAFPEKTSTLEK